MSFKREPFTKDTFDESKCIICQSDSTEVLSKVTDRGQPALLNYCKVREWPVLSEIMSSAVGLTVFIHSSCRKRFTRLTTSEKADSDSADDKPHKQLRSADAIFEWKTSCFLCKEEVDFKQDQSRARRACTLELCTAILRHCSQRADAWAVEVQGRTESCCDSVAEDAVYHFSCYALFATQHSLSGHGQRGRLEDGEMRTAFCDLRDWLEGS